MKATATKDIAMGEAGVPDTMRNGFLTVRSECAPKHPMENMQNQFIKHQEQMNMAVAGSVIGRSMPMQLLRERAAFSQIKRLPVLPSSMIALEISLGREATLDFQDYLGDPSEAEVMGSLHGMMEAQNFNAPGHSLPAKLGYH